MPPKYLIQDVTGRMYHYDEILAAKSDMRAMDPAIAKVRIDATRKNIESRKAMAAEGTPDEYVAKLSELSKRLSDLVNEFDVLEKAEKDRVDIDRENNRLEREGTPKSSIPSEEELHQEKIDEDPHIIRIKAMATWDELNNYMVTEFGEDIKKTKTNIDRLKVEVIGRRVERIEEAG